MRFLKRKWGYGFDDVNEDDGLYWAATGLQLGCTGLSFLVCKHNTIFNNNREGSPAPRRRIDSKQMLNLPDGAERRLLVFVIMITMMVVMMTTMIVVMMMPMMVVIMITMMVVMMITIMVVMMITMMVMMMVAKLYYTSFR